VALYLFLAGVGAGLYLVGASIEFWRGAGGGGEGGRSLDWARWAIALGGPLGGIGTLFLIWDLGRPERFFRAFRRVNTAWIARGTWILLGFILVSVAQGGGWLLLGWGEDPSGTGWLAFNSLGSFLALATAVYTGFLIGAMIPRPMWNTPLLPFLFLVSALSTGLGATFLVVWIWEMAPGPKTGGEEMASLLAWLAGADIGLLVLEMFMVYAYLAPSWSKSPEAVHLLLQGSLSPLFWVGFVGAGVAVPLALEGYSLTVGETGARVALQAGSGMLLLAGGLILRLLILAAGLRVPIRLGTAFYVRPGV
jgi:formate-dependent nitrite reductase membrane component NrfD